jgi:hypothetical protein
MKKVYISILSLASVFALATGCGSDKSSTEKSDAEVLEVDVIDVDVEEEEMSNVFYALPSPFELASLLRASGVEYDAEVLNNPESVANYTTTHGKAINLGIYGADLSLSSIYDQTQETMLYLKAIKIIADDLGLTAAFDGGTMERLERAKDNKDSLQRIVADSYLMANSYLKENAKSSTASLVLAGGWIEGVHIATSLVDLDKPNEDLKELVADQRYSIENLIGLLSTHTDEVGITEMIADFESLKMLFDEIKEVESKHTNTTEGGKMVLGGSVELDFPHELLVKIVNKVNEIRTGFVN